jgi:hypothetical protein
MSVTSTCPDCHKLVRFKPVVGTMHVCISSCQKAGRHLDPVVEKVGPPWRRRRQIRCRTCNRSEAGGEG